MTKMTAMLVLFLILLTGCQMPLQQVRPVLVDEGETYIYLRPFPRDAEPLSFALAAVSAVRADGAEVPLNLRFSEFKGGEMNRQRLVASTPLPPGRYKGISFTVGNASLKGEEGVSALLVSKEPAHVDFAFEVKKNRALLIALVFDYDKSLNGVQFNPFFTASIPGRPLVTLTGYVTNQGSNTITVFDRRAGEAVDVIQTGRGPAGIVIDQRQRRAYVLLTGEEAIDVIDIANGAITDRIRLRPGDAPRDLALTPDGTILLTANNGSNTISMLDPAGLVEFARFNVGNQPASVVIDRAGRKAYIFNSLTNNIAILDIPNRSLLPAVLPSDSIPIRGDFSRKGDRFYVFQSWSPFIEVFNPLTTALDRKVYDEIGIAWIKVDTNTDKIYVGKSNAGIVEIYDPFSFISGEYIPVAGGVSHMTIDGEENNLVLIIPDKRLLQIINLVSRSVVREIDLDDDPYWTTMMGER
jgi:YVTN family beta-propeller protein